MKCRNKSGIKIGSADNKRKDIKHWHQVTLYLMFYDMMAVAFSYFAALLLRFDLSFSSIPSKYLEQWIAFTPLYIIFCIVVFCGLRLYKSVWRFASFTELQRIMLASIITYVFHVAVTRLSFRMPVSYYIFGAIIQFMLITAVRFFYRFVLLLRSRKKSSKIDNVMLIGGGAAGLALLREIGGAKEMNEKVVCIIDDNPNKWYRYIKGVQVVGGRDTIIENAKKYNVNKIYIAIPSISAKQRKTIIDICKNTDCEIKILPGMYELALDRVSVSYLKNIDVEDLLGRESVKMNSKEVWEYLEGKTALVTGGGGSIGSELCRQIAQVKGLKRLIIFDVYENNAHAIKLELSEKYPNLDLVVLIGSVRDSKRIKQVFAQYRPNIVFHAAAHKHVPLMEDSPCEAIKNNVFGTYHTAYAAMAYGCEKFLLISTDKAVNPVGIMGASKRLCEMVIQSFAKKIEKGKAFEILDLSYDNKNKTVFNNYNLIKSYPKTDFVAVRFGNVLGSNGSVIPRFREQIKNGGPVTVTHPEITRYFMTISEAVSLVLTASTFGGNGKIFVLDMGTAVKIDDLARNMIRLSGFKPDEDINIIYTGLRPGEKLYEERLMDEENLQGTSNDLINIGHPLNFDENEFLNQLRYLMKAAYEEYKDINELVAHIVPTYHPVNEINIKENVLQIKEFKEA